MRAIQVSSWTEPPAFTASAASPSQPAEGSVQIHVLAAGLHNLVRAQSAKKHFSMANATLPYTPGSDGVGFTHDGRLVYFNSVAAGGGFAETVNVPSGSVFPVPVAETASDAEKRELGIRIASLFNPAASSWMAMTTRTAHLRTGFTVLIHGVTSLSGQIAVSIARYLGAKTVIGVARNATAMAKLDLDHMVQLSEDDDANHAATTDFSILKTTKVDLILDYIWGPPTAHLLASLPSNPLTAHENEVQVVQIGGLSGADELSLSTSVLRSRNITLRGSAPGSWSVTKDVGEQYPRLLERFVDATIKHHPVRERQLEDVRTAWADTKSRSVFVI